MTWNLDFISEEDFKEHVRATIMKYGEKLESYDLKRFNSNLIDPIKLIFDKSVYRTSCKEIFKKVVKELEENYHVEYDTLNAVDFGVPQIRKRLVLHGIRNDVYNNLRLNKEK